VENFQITILAGLYEDGFPGHPACVHEIQAA
jgi:hypothetical protein